MGEANTHRITSDDGATAATYALAAGMVCCSLEHQGRELLDLGRGLEAYAERGKTMGIPLLYPWANRLADFEYEAAGRRVALPHDPAEIPTDEHGLPIHGLIPNLMAWEATPRGPTLTAELDWSAPRLLRLFPFEHRVRMEAAVEHGALTVTTTVHATGRERLPVSFGFHPYLRIPGGERDRAEINLPGCERLLTDELSIPTGAREPLGPRTIPLAGTSWDDGLIAAERPARFSATAGQQTISMELGENYGYAQIYAPPDRDFICFEPMTAPTNALRSGTGLTVLEPGDQFSATFRISTQPVR